MKNKQSLTRSGVIENRIFTLRGTQVMLDSHLAELYNVETKRMMIEVALALSSSW